ncbi:MAG: peptidase M15B and M15C D D-carboxypeptidase VanY/endolysin [Bacillota bacterium]|nr:MAG: peptidase M15B and M15C D D-carboxypeptidase VanY/endolysin [Bacillota bacterium]MBS3950946.1 M15 family metallopeptidase [Peptococcaceae bacterium]
MSKTTFSVTAIGIAVISLLWIGFFQPYLTSSARTLVPVPLPPIVDEPIKHVLAFENTTLIDRNNRQVILNMDSVMVFVNKLRNLPADYAPLDLIIPSVPFTFSGDEPRKYMRTQAALALEQLFAEAKNLSLDLFATSGYRSYDKQKSIFNNSANLKGEEEANKTSARPGQSEHQTGLAMDVTSSKVGYNLVESFGTTTEGIWLRENAHAFGFIIRYPKGKEYITGYSYEPWHLRYVGLEVAEYIYTHSLTLEEYFQQKHGY